MKSLLVALLSLSVLGGCASVRDSRELLDAAKNCCNHPREFQFLDLRENVGIEATLSESSPAFDFASGRSFFQGYRLPSADRPWRVRIRTDPTGFGMGSRGPFCPSLSILGREFKELGSTYVPAIWSPPGGGKGGFFFTEYEIPPGASFVVVHMERRNHDEKLMKYSRYYNPALGAVQLFFSGPLAVSYSPCSVTGRIEVTLLRPEGESTPPR